MSATQLHPIHPGDLPLPIVADPVEAAKTAGLRYYTADRPGIRRRPAGRGFRYIGPDGEPVRDPKELQRIKSLAIPPAWTDVWICPSPRGHLQAVGRDARGRKQYRYHPKWRETRDETKYFRMILFGQTLPTVRERADSDLSLACVSREKVLATVVRLLDETGIRVGNEEYARENRSYGLTTLRRRHVDVSGSTLHFHFRGKSGKEHVVDVRDRRLARAVRRCEDIPGYELFHYLDENGNRHSIGSEEVNDYLREITGQDFTAKDFRTWHGTVTAAAALHEIGPFASETEAKRNLAQAVQQAADFLGNTPAICRKSYVHPAVVEAYVDGWLSPVWEEALDPTYGREGLRPDEVATLHLLREHAERELRQAAAG